MTIAPTVPPYPVPGEPTTELMVRDLYGRVQAIEQVVLGGNGRPPTPTGSLKLVEISPLQVATAVVNFNNGWGPVAMQSPVLLARLEAPFVILGIAGSNTEAFADVSGASLCVGYNRTGIEDGVMAFGHSVGTLEGRDVGDVFQWEHEIMSGVYSRYQRHVTSPTGTHNIVVGFNYTYPFGLRPAGKTEVIMWYADSGHVQSHSPVPVRTMVGQPVYVPPG
jgi:hypothetical protein